MAGAHGSDSHFEIHDGSSSRNITPYLKTIDVNRGRAANDSTTKGAEGMTYRGGLTDGEIRITGLWDDTASVGTRKVFTTLMAISASAAPTAFIWGPEGSTTGMEKTSGDALLTQYDESSPIDDLVAFTATLKISGDLTDGTF